MTRAKVFDLFGGEYKDEPKLTVETPEEEAGKAKSDKIDRAERLIDHYCIHLNTIINYGTYSDYMDPSEIVKMSQIQLCMKTSQHPEAGALGGLYNTVIDIVRRTSSAQDFASWQKSIDDEIARVRNVWPGSDSVVPSEEGQNTGVPPKTSIHVLTRDILRYLQEKGYKNPIAEQTVSSSMQKHVVLEKNKCEGLNEDIKWKKAQIKRDHGNLRGYRIDFESESKRRAFERIKKMKDERPF